MRFGSHVLRTGDNANNRLHYEREADETEQPRSLNCLSVVLGDYCV